VPRVSVITPAHNAVAYMGETIESVRGQTFRDWEMVVVDDGSSDGTWELLQSAGPDVRSFRRERPGGPARARNLALANATGELVAFLDADDLLLPGYLESQIECYERALDEGGGAVGLVTCDAQIMVDGKRTSHTHLQRIHDRDAPLTLERILRRNPIYISSLVPASVGESVGWFDPELFGTEDFGLWIKILEAGYRAVLNDRVLAVYRRTSGALSSNIASQGVNNRRAYELALERGRLTPRQRRIARGAIRYNRAMEDVALLRFGGPAASRPLLRVVRRLPRLVWVAMRNPRRWPEWLALLRTGRALDAAELRGHR